MTTSATLLPGVDRWGAGYRVRVKFPEPFGRHTETGIASATRANMRALELRELRDNNMPPPASPTTGGRTLKDAADKVLAAKLVSGDKAKLSPSGVAYWTRSLKPWREGPFAEVLLAQLNPDEVADAQLDRAAEHPTSARNERQALLAALDEAARRGWTFDARLRLLPRVVVERQRERRALSADELEHLARHVPDYARRLVLLQGTVGNRIGELFAQAPEHVRLDEAVVDVPRANTKERRGKTIPLTPEEVALYREQLGGLQLVDAASTTADCPAMPTGSRYLFTTKTGKPWRHNQFDRFVWQKAVKRAAAAWRAEHDLDEQAPTPFEWYVDGERRTITTHDLRSTAVTLMRDAGMSKEDAAARVGHVDTKLVDAVYDQGDRAARVGRALAAAAPQGLRRTLSEAAPQQATSPAASAVSLNGQAI